MTAKAKAAATPEVEAAPKVARTQEDVTHYAFDNEHADGVVCTLTFADGATATATEPRTGDLPADQLAATVAALEA